MNCPACKEPLLTIEYEQIELDYCAACLGVWLDEGELELLLGGHDLAHGFLTAGSPARSDGEAPRPCPICDAAMRKAVTGGARPVVYDQCRQRHGLWFDQGELLAVIEQGLSHAGGAPVQTWLRNIFSHSPSNP